MQKFIVETVVTFREVHFVEAENREFAEKIALNSDYNLSKHVGTQVTTTYDFTDQDLQRFRKEDEYLWEGLKKVDVDGTLMYRHPSGEWYKSESGEKIIFGNDEKTA
jgi:hypothetical protein